MTTSQAVELANIVAEMKHAARMSEHVGSDIAAVYVKKWADRLAALLAEREALA
jgi:hypothetical protein